MSKLVILLRTFLAVTREVGDVRDLYVSVLWNHLLTDVLFIKIDVSTTLP